MKASGTSTFTELKSALERSGRRCRWPIWPKLGRFAVAGAKRGD